MANYKVRFFSCWDYVTGDLKNWDFKKKRTLPHTTMKLFVFDIIRNHRENNYLETSLSFNKLHKNYDKSGQCLLFFCHRRSEKFQLM